MNSICLASYNGGAYIQEQLANILSQIGSDDEVLVGDDGSSDSTLDVVSNINDPRVRVIRNSSNLGHVGNFENLIREAKGEIIFLSDQDDRWAADKYQSVLGIFRRRPEVQVIHHSLIRMNERGDLIEQQPIEIASWRKEHLLLAQLIKSYVFGCCLAFRSDLKRILLPFPRSVYAHDHWIALAAGVVGGFHHHDEPLLYYRIHGRNLTPKRPLPLLRKLKLRWLQIQHYFELIKRKAAR